MRMAVSCRSMRNMAEQGGSYSLSLHLHFDDANEVDTVKMALPIFLRPLLLIEYYWQTLVYTLNRWLQRSNEE